MQVSIWYPYFQAILNNTGNCQYILALSVNNINQYQFSCYLEQRHNVMCNFNVVL
jgi:hypothetical protein